MKKIFLLVLMLFSATVFSGCGISDYIKSNSAASSAVSAGVSGSIVAAVQNNPKIKADVINYLNLVKEYLNCTECSMDDLLTAINDKFPKKYKPYGAIMADVVADNYMITTEKISADDKALIIKNIDRALKYIELIEG